MPGTVSSDAVAPLITRLSDDDWHVRRDAANALVTRADTDPAVRAGVAATTGPASSAETRAEAAGVLARIDQRAAHTPTRITLHLKDTSRREAFAALARQAGVSINTDNVSGRSRREMPGRPRSTVSLDLDNEPFWSAVDKLCAAADCRIETSGSGSQLRVYEFGSESMLQGPQSIDPDDRRFVVFVRSISRDREVRFDGRHGGAAEPQRSANDEVQFELFADPKALLVDSAEAATLDDAVDDKGHSLLPDNGLADRHAVHFGSGGGLRLRFGSSLVYPDDGYTRLVKLDGRLRVVVASGRKTLTIPDATRAVGRPSGGWSGSRWTVTVAKATVAPAAAAATPGTPGAPGTPIHVNFELEARNDDPARRVSATFHMLRTVRLTDADGLELNQSSNGGSGNDDVVHWTIAFDGTQPVHFPLALVWELPVSTTETAVKFHFSNLPLPLP